MPSVIRCNDPVGSNRMLADEAKIDVVVLAVRESDVKPTACSQALRIVKHRPVHLDVVCKLQQAGECVLRDAGRVDGQQAEINSNLTMAAVHESAPGVGQQHR